MSEDILENYQDIEDYIACLADYNKFNEKILSEYTFREIIMLYCMNKGIRHEDDDNTLSYDIEGITVNFKNSFIDIDNEC